jgi:hypothetical protein
MVEPLTSAGGTELLTREIKEEAGRLAGHPIDEIRRLEHVAIDGESPATPLLTLVGVLVAVALIYAVVTTVAMLVYYWD